MSLVVMLRPLAFAALSSTVLLPGLTPASAQHYTPPYSAPSRYGAPYMAPPPSLPQPSMAGARQPAHSYGDPYRHPQPSVHARPGIWHGLYMGASVGYGQGGTTPTSSLGSSDTVDTSGALLGGYAGYNWQYRELVLGIEGDGAWSNVDGARTFGGPLSVTAQNDWLMSARLRAGYSFSNLLVYATGGVAWAGYDISLADSLGSSRASETLVGYVFGAGIEVKLAESWSARFEGLHYGFNDRDFRFSGGTLPVDSNITTVRAGITFHFN